MSKRRRLSKPVPPLRIRQRKARRERRQLIRWLRKKGKTPAALHIASKLQSCVFWEPCNSGACPGCMTRAQENLAKALRTMIGTSSKDETVFTLTVVTEAEQQAVGSLASYDATNHKRRLRRRLKGLSITWAAGGLDFSLNEHRELRYAPFWMPHVYLVGVTAAFETLQQQLRSLLPATDEIPRPFRLRRWDGRSNALYYALKPDFVRRVGTDEGQRFVRKSGMLQTCRTTRDQRLRSAEKLEILEVLDGLTIPGRFINLRCQVHQSQQHYRILLTP